MVVSRCLRLLVRRMALRKGVSLSAALLIFVGFLGLYAYYHSEKFLGLHKDSLTPRPVLVVSLPCVLCVLCKVARNKLHFM